jgi:hypothetical protein
MACFKHGTIIDLAPRESVPLSDMRGTTLRVTRGMVWITQENDTQDIVLRAGDTWTIEKNGLTIVEAQQDATVCALGRRLEPRIAAPRKGRSGLDAFLRSVGAWVEAQFAARARRPLPHY